MAVRIMPRATVAPEEFNEAVSATSPVERTLEFNSLVHPAQPITLLLRRDARSWYVSLTAFMAMRRAVCPWHERHPFDDGKCPQCLDEVSVSEEIKYFGPVSQNKLYVQLR